MLATLALAAAALCPTCDLWPTPKTYKFETYRTDFFIDVGAASTSALLDLYTTERVIGAGGRELNPFMKSDRVLKQLAHVAVRAAVSYQLRKRGHKKTANLLRYISFSIGVGAAVHNYHQYHQGGRE